MMKTKLGLCLVLALAMVGACGSDEEADLVEFQRSGGFAGGSERVVIEEDGTTTRTARDGSITTTTLPNATVDDLHRKIDEADFDSLAPRYGSGPIADGFVYVITVRLDGDTHTVEVTEGSDYPSQLTPVIIALNEINDAPEGE